MCISNCKEFIVFDLNLYSCLKICNSGNAKNFLKHENWESLNKLVLYDILNIWYVSVLMKIKYIFSKHQRPVFVDMCYLY